MTKRLMAGLLGIALLFSTAGCSSEQNNTNNSSPNVIINNDNTQKNEQPATDSANKLTGEIEFGTEYTNGLAFVKVKGENKNYCIDKKGNIVFEMDNILFQTENPRSAYAAVTTGFYNDIALITDVLQVNYVTICDKTGKITTAEELGVTYFLPEAHKDGYIIAVAEGQKSKDDKLGILNTKLEWVVEPSADIVAALGMEYGVKRSTRFYHDFVLYGAEGSVDIRTGALSEDSYRTKGKHVQASVPNYWSIGNDGYYNSDNELVLDVSSNSELQNIGNATVDIDGAEFSNGKSPVVFSNSSETTHFSVIDVNGKTLFQPVDFGENIDYIKVDGNYIFVVGNQHNNHTTARLYDLDGNLIGELDPTVICINASFTMQDEVVKVSFALIVVDNNGNVTNDSVRWVKYFGTDLQPLF